MSRIEPATQISPRLIQEDEMRKPLKHEHHHLVSIKKTAYRHLIAGTFGNTGAATIALPSRPVLAGRPLHAVWPASTPSDAPTADGLTPRATNPTLQGADGTIMQLPGEPGAVYTLLQTPNCRLNGRVPHWGDRRSTVDHLGLLLITPDGYSRVHIGAASASSSLAEVNGIPIRAGQSVRLSDGGLLHASRSASHIYIRSPHNYTATITRHQTPSGPLLGLQLSPAPLQNPTIEPSKTGLLAQSFQKPIRSRLATPYGEPYAGPLSELMVTSGLFGPSESSPQNSLIPASDAIGPVYQHYFDLAPERSFTDLGEREIMTHWEWINQQSVQLELIQNAAARERKLKEHERKQELLLAAALKGGQIDLAILLLAATETQSANDLTRRLVRRIHQLQQQRQGLSAQMAQVGQGDEASDSSQLQGLVTRASNIATEISLLQTFLQDAVASKRNIQEFASNWIQQSHQTTRSIIQSIGR